MNTRQSIAVKRDVSILRAHAIAAALLAARPNDYETNHVAYDAWYDTVRYVASVVCTADGVSLLRFYSLSGVPS